MIWRKKREMKDSGAASHPTVEGNVAKAGLATGAHPSELAASRGALGDAPRNSDQIATGVVHTEPNFQSVSEAQASQRRYAIPRAYRVWGRLVSARPVCVRGEMVDGEIISPIVTVLPGGCVRANTQANTVQVAGIVEGAVNARLVDVDSLGELRGAVNATQLRVLPGAKLAGAVLKVG